jgi:hypothetical protein
MACGAYALYEKQHGFKFVRTCVEVVAEEVVPKCPLDYSLYLPFVAHRQPASQDEAFDGLLCALKSGLHCSLYCALALVSLSSNRPPDPVHAYSEP